MIASLFRRKLESEKGYTLAFTLGVVLVLVIVGAALLALVQNEALRLIQYRDSQEAYFLAEAGINRALWNIDLGRRTDATVGSEASPVSLGRGGYWTTYDTAAKILTSTGKVSGVTRAIIVRVNDEVVPSAFDTAVFSAQFNAIPDNVTIWNDCDVSEPNPNKVVVVNYGTSALTIQGWVKNKPYATYGLGYAYCAKGITPTSKKDVQWKEATEDPGYEWVVFNRSDYQSAIIAADKDGDEDTEGNYVWESDYNLTPSSSYPGASWDAANHRWLVDGNLTIRNCTITSTSATLSSPAQVVVYGTLTIQDATIGASDADNYIHITAGGREDYKPTLYNANDYSSGKPKLWSSAPIMTIRGTDPDYNKRVYIYKEVQLYSNGQTEIYNAVNMSQASIYSLGEISVTSDQPGVKLNLKGDVFSKEKVSFTTTGSGVGIEIEGSCIAGCKCPNPTSPGDLITYTGQIHFGEVSKPIDLIFNRGAKAESGPGGAFQVSAGATLDYSTWREK